MIKIIPVGIENVYKLISNGNEYLATKNLAPGISVYGELRFGIDPEYRVWNPYRSKLAAMILKHMKIPLHGKSKILYLGAAMGTTASHISDIASNGLIYAVEFSHVAASELLEVCSHRSNLIPIFANARKPRDYALFVDQVEVIYQDIAQRDQVEIAINNARHFLKQGGYIIIAIKARSINAAAKPRAIFEAALEKLSQAFNLEERKTLEPYHRDHLAVIARFIN
ncbi:MAG: fibrillarin-like rRNA/tRNA 2'-O-methyltransferase [Methanocellales archaeon]